MRAVALFHALSEPTRLRVLGVLRGGERCVCDLMELVDAPQSLLSFHLRTLRDAGLVRDRRDGRWIHYSLDPDALDEARRLLETLAPKPRRAGGASCCGS